MNKLVNTSIIFPFFHRGLIDAKVCKELEVQCQQLCGTSNPSLFRKSDPQSLLSLSTSAVAAELRDRAPLFYNLMAAASGVPASGVPSSGVPSGDSEHTASLVTAAATLLYARNKHTSALPQSIGLILDFGGATDKTLSAMSTLGLSVATSTILEKKAAIAAHHDRLIEYTIIQRKDTITTTRSTTGLQETACPQDPAWEIYGDNLDHSVHTYHMTKDNRGKDIHWFLLVGAPMRVVPPPGLDKTRPRRNIH